MGVLGEGGRDEVHASFDFTNRGQYAIIPKRISCEKFHSDRRED